MSQILCQMLVRYNDPCGCQVATAGGEPQEVPLLQLPHQDGGWPGGGVKRGQYN